MPRHTYIYSYVTAARFGSCRLGETEKAIYHYERSDTKDESSILIRAQALKTILIQCREAHKLGDWNTLLKECHHAITMGADSVPQVDKFSFVVNINIKIANLQPSIMNRRSNVHNNGIKKIGIQSICLISNDNESVQSYVCCYMNKLTKFSN